MKHLLSVILLTAFVGSFSLTALAQSGSREQAGADDMRLRLLELHAKEAELQARGRQLDEQLKPENIERSLAGIGSTKPEELRELRRRQLTIEKDGITAQLRLVAKNRERLEAAVTAADADAYQRSADVTTPITQAFKADEVRSFRWPIALLSAAVAIGIFVLIVSFRKFSLR